jgi:hypothetical protein
MAALGLLHVLVGPVGVAVDGTAAILGTLAAVGGGLAAGGIAGGFLSRPDRRSPESFVPDENEELFDQAERLRDPNFGFSQFRRLASDTAGTADQRLQATAATGGSERMARLQQAEREQQRADQMLDQFGQFRLQTNQQANQMLQAGVSNQMQGQQMAQRQNLQRSQATQNLFGSIANLGAGLAGQGVGGMMSNQMFGQMRQQSMPQGQFMGGGLGGQNMGMGTYG